VRWKKSGGIRQFMDNAAGGGWLPSVDGMKFFGANNHGAKKVGMLKNVPIFQTLTRNELLEVDELLHERTYEAGEIIFEKGEVGHGIYIILEGRVKVNPCPELPANAILELGQNEIIGEFALFEELPRLATVVATERTTMAALFRSEFSSLLTTNKNIGVKVLVEITRILGRRARQLLIRERDVPTI
jgi:CRP/FNR family cyclic AMP-dependent transcriptional regulator